MNSLKRIAKDTNDVAAEVLRYAVRRPEMIATAALAILTLAEALHEEFKR